MKYLLDKKILLTAIVFILVMIGGANWYFRSQPPVTDTRWQAARELKANHQIREGDITESNHGEIYSTSPPLQDVVGKYLTISKNKDDVVKKEELASFPQITPMDNGASAVFYPLSEKQIIDTGLIDVGSKLKLCTITSPTNAATCVESLEVLAIRKKTHESPAEWLLLKTSEAKQKEIGQIMTAEKQIFMIQ